MKKFLFILLIIYSTFLKGQSFANFKDTTNHFSIDIPIGWHYEIPLNSTIKLLASRTPLSATDTTKDSYNLNILMAPDYDLEKVYSTLIQVIESSRENFILIDHGDTIINGKKFRWLIETHKNKDVAIQMHNYDFLTIHHNKIYALTMTTFSPRFEVMKPTFIKIANSLILTE